jgi:general secretion pathway protein D
VGITLRIKPQIGEGGTVRMTIFQEQQRQGTVTAAGTSNAGPSTTKRSIETTVVVDDGQIMVLGGLIEGPLHTRRARCRCWATSPSWAPVPQREAASASAPT